MMSFQEGYASLLLHLCVFFGDTESDNAVPRTNLIAWKL